MQPTSIQVVHTMEKNSACIQELDQVGSHSFNRIYQFTTCDYKCNDYENKGQKNQQTK